MFAPEGTTYPEGAFHRRLTARQATETYAASGHEVAVHGLTHPFLERLPENLAMWELLKDRENLENQFHTIIRGMAYPFGTYSDATVDCLRKAGLAYGRTVISSHSFDLPGDWLRLEATCHHNDPELMEKAAFFAEFGKRQYLKLMYVWGHSYEFDDRDNWGVMEEFCRYMGGRKDIWYATNIEIIDYMEAAGRLKFSGDNGMVYNPGAASVWLQIDDRAIVEVKGGATVSLLPA